MDSSSLWSLLGPSLATLVGGMVASFGLSGIARSGRGRAFVQGWPGWGLALYYLVVLAVLGGGTVWMIGVVRSGFTGAWLTGHVTLFATLGVIVGLPFTLPTVTRLWRSRRAGLRTGKSRPVSREQRRQYAQDLERELRDVTEDARSFRLELREEKGTVLFVGGQLSRQEGERLVAALRPELATVGFRRVEGEHANRKWWVPV